MKKILLKISCLLFLLSILWIGHAESSEAKEDLQLANLPRNIVQWDADGLGNHRAVVEVLHPSDIVWARIAWRRIDLLPSLKGVVVTSAKDGVEVANAVVVACNAEYGDILFEAKEVGNYYVYYMPYQEIKKDWNPFPNYLQTKPAAATWISKTTDIAETILGGNVPIGVERAAALSLESNSATNAFTVMEVPATQEETRNFLGKWKDRNIIFYQERNTTPICMTKAIPAAWIGREPIETCKLAVKAGEELFVQLGAIAPKKELIDLQMGYIGFRDPAGILSSDFKVHCLNFGGTDFQGMPLIKKLSLKQGEVLPLWIRISVPEDIPAGLYRGDFYFSGWNLLPTSLPVELEITETAPSDSSLARLKWLDSDIGLGINTTNNFPEITFQGKNISLNGHVVELSPMGLPSAIDSNLLAMPIDFRIKVSGNWQEWTNESLLFDETDGSFLDWESINYAPGVMLGISAHTEADGFISLNMTMNAETDCCIEDAELVFTFTKEEVPYFMGLGERGGKRLDFLEWRWSKNANQFFWFGDIDSGLYCKLLDYGEKQDVYFMPEPYRDWCGDETNGKISIRTTGEQVNVIVSTGKLLLTNDNEKILRFQLMLTPFGHYRPEVATQKVFVGSDDIWKSDFELPNADSVTIGYNANHNPYLNYPFPSQKEIVECAKKIHDSGKKAHYVFGTREIPYQINEFWPLWSLSHEIFSVGLGIKTEQEKYGAAYAEKAIPFIGNPWLCEHLGEGYSASWLSRPSGDRELVTLLVNPLSRWQNYYLESVDYLLGTWNLDGIQTTLTDRRITRRLRNIVREKHPDVILDFATGNNLRPENGMANPMAQYMEHLSLVDRIIFTEGFSYGSDKDYYLVELSGVPFGITTSFGGTTPWRSLLYGSMPQMRGNDVGLKKLWEICDDFGLKDSMFVGYWNPKCPIETDDENVLASAFVRGDKILFVLSNWANENRSVVLNLSRLERVGISSEGMKISIPEIQNLQDSLPGAPMLSVTLSPGKVLIGLIQKE